MTTINPQGVAALVAHARWHGRQGSSNKHDLFMRLADTLEALMRECERLSALTNGTAFVALVEALEAECNEHRSWRVDNMKRALKAEAERDALAEKVQKMEAVVEAVRKWKEHRERAGSGDYQDALNEHELASALSTLDGDKQ